VLIIGREVHQVEAMRDALTRHGYECTVTHEGATALELARSGDLDLILLDLKCPERSGHRFVEELRHSGIDTPVLKVTAEEGDHEEAAAFDLGVDDYLTKPFSTVVLLARMKSLLRRRLAAPYIVHAGALRVDTQRHRCWLGDDEIIVSPRELATLTYMAERFDVVVSKQELLDEVWGRSDLPHNVVEVCIRQIRKKVGPARVHTVRGVGYRLVDPGS